MKKYIFRPLISNFSNASKGSIEAPNIQSLQYVDWKGETYNFKFLIDKSNSYRYRELSLVKEGLNAKTRHHHQSPYRRSRCWN
jgi:hypothetical protein